MAAEGCSSLPAHAVDAPCAWWQGHESIWSYTALAKLCNILQRLQVIGATILQVLMLPLLQNKNQGHQQCLLMRSSTGR